MSCGKVDYDDVWSKLPHISIKQCIWLGLIAWNGAACGFSQCFENIRYMAYPYPILITGKIC